MEVTATMATSFTGAGTNFYMNWAAILPLFYINPLLISAAWNSFMDLIPMQKGEF